MNIFVFGDKLFKSEVKRFFLKSQIELNISYLDDVEQLKELLENKSEEDFFIIDEKFIYDSNSFFYKINPFKKIYKNKIDKKYLKTKDNLCFETTDSIIEYILKESIKSRQENNLESKTNEEVTEEIEQNEIKNEEKIVKKPEEITDIDEIEEDMLNNLVQKD